MPLAANNVKKLSVYLLTKDLERFGMVNDYGVCAIDHFIRRFSPEYKAADRKKAWSIRSAEYRRVKQLAQAKYLQLRRVPALDGKGSGRNLIALGPAGARALADYLKVPRSEIPYQPSRVDSAYFAAHDLAIADVRQALELAIEQHSGLELTEWISERELRQPQRRVKVQDPKTQEIKTLIADGVFTIQRQNGTAQGYRLEVDLTGTTAARRQRQKLRLYLAHLAVDRRPVLWVAPNQATARLIAERCHREAAGLGADPTLFWVTSRELLSEDTILTPIWTVVGGPTIALIPNLAPQGGAQWMRS
jgi:hypothetical protein